MDYYIEEMGARYYRYLKFGERLVSVRESRRLDNALMGAQRDLILRGKRPGKKAAAAQGTEESLGAAQAELLKDLRKQFSGESDDTVFLCAFILVCILEMVCAILLPVHAWNNGNHNILFIILMVMAGIFVGSLIALILAVPIWHINNLCRKLKIAKLLARAVVIEQLYNVALIGSDTFPDVEYE